MDFQKVIDKRCSTRLYDKRPVSKSMIVKLIKNGCKAPSTNNNQPWNFVVVRGEKRDLIAKATNKYLNRHLNKKDTTTNIAEYVIDFYQNLGSAPVIILVYMNKNENYKHAQKLSIAAATQNIILSAVNEGLGTCWMGTFNSINRSINKIINIDKNKELVSGFILGYPAKDFKPIKRDKKNISDVTIFI